MESFFKVKTPEEVHRILDRFGPAGTERVPIEAALDRVLCEEITAPEDLPLFPRSSMDGYAVRAKDTFGAAESLPALLEVIGEIPMGGAPSKELGPGQALRISTGGMLPQGADAVVMVEYCRLMDEKTLEVDRPVSRRVDGEMCREFVQDWFIKHHCYSGMAAQWKSFDCIELPIGQSWREIDLASR